MNKSLWSRLQPHAIAIGIFLIVSCLYCIPALQGLVVEQHDVQGWKGMAQQSFEFKEKYGYFPLWTNSMFSGMPAFQIALESKHNITIAYLHHLFMLFLPTPAGLFFLACVGFYILAVVLRLRSWIGILGSVGYAFASYSAVIVAVGHTTKFASMGYAPALLAGLILLTQRRYVLGFLATLVFATLLFYQNHVQIAYYTFLIAACLGIAYLLRVIREKDFKHLAISAALAVVAVIMGILSYSVVLFPTYDYSKETMRGGRSELTQAVALDKNSANKTKGGLDKEYAFRWSYGIAETATLILPRAFGGSNGTVVNNQSYSEFPAETKTGDVLIERTGMPDEQAADFIRPWAYWGPQPGTSGPVYLGAVICALFIFGLIFYTGWHKWWIIAATVIGVMLAWGSNFSALNYLLFDYLPFYNKFRAPSMAMVIPQLTVPLLAALGLNQLVSQDYSKDELWKKFKKGLYAIGAVALVLIAMYFTLDYRGESDQTIRDNLTNGILQQMAQGQQPTPDMQAQANDFGRSITNALKDDRRSMFGSDLVRSLIYIALAVGLMYLFVSNKLKANVLLYGLTALVAADLISVDARYLSTKNYVDKDTFEAAFTPNRADLQIKQDTSYFRVFDQADPAGAFESSRAAYHHNAIGGYHPAKLGLYDDIIKNQLSKGNLQVFNMLNTKYFIMSNPQDRQPVAQQNPGALGPVWFVKTIKYVNNADEEMSALDTFEPEDTAIIDKREQPKVTFTPVFDSSANIQLVQNLNDKITYTSKANSNQFAVFSEVYYPNGWKAFIDNKPVEIVKVNYVLRGLPVPAGNHTIEFRFEPRAYMIGDTVSLIIGIASILLLLAGAWWEWKQYNKQQPVRHREAV